MSSEESPSNHTMPSQAIIPAISSEEGSIVPGTMYSETKFTKFIDLPEEVQILVMKHALNLSADVWSQWDAYFDFDIWYVISLVLYQTKSLSNLLHHYSGVPDLFDHSPKRIRKLSLLHVNHHMYKIGNIAFWEVNNFPFSDMSALKKFSRDISAPYMGTGNINTRVIPG